MPLIKVYGERNTGTNYFGKLLSLNFSVAQVPGVVPNCIIRLQRILPGKERIRDIYFYLTFYKNLGWKHSVVKPPDKIRQYSINRCGLYFVTITKNPYSWLLSLYRQPYHQTNHQKDDFKNFLTAPWKTVGRENAPSLLSSPIELWNIKNTSYIQLKNSLPAFNIKFEDLLEDPKAVLRQISTEFSIPLKTSEFINYEQSTKDQAKTYDFYRDYYLNEKWKNQLSGRVIKIINAALSNKLLNIFGYEKL